jgi:serine O-acetyltransferase
MTRTAEDAEVGAVEDVAEEDERYVRKVWEDIKRGAEDLVKEEPLLGGLIYSKILNQRSFEKSLSYLLSSKIGNAQVLSGQWQELIFQAIVENPQIALFAAKDILAIRERDPACTNAVHCYLFYKGFSGLQTQRVSHWLWKRNRKQLAFYMQSLVSEIFGMDLHPAAKFGHGIMIDHATSVVVGETAVIGDNCTLFHGVTLGGTGKERGDRHPKLGNRVVVGSNASILGNVRVGDDCKIGSSAVLVHDVPQGTTIVGTKGKVLKRNSLMRSRL